MLHLQFKYRYGNNYLTFRHSWKHH